MVTDSRLPGEPKATEGSALFQIYQAFASEEETTALRQAYADGIAWGDAKQMLFERIDREIAPMRAAYEDLMAHPDRIEAALLAGAAKARAIATPFMARVRHSVGLRRLESAVEAGPAKMARAHTAAFKQYREKDGQFYFKLVDATGTVLLQSRGFESPKVAGQAIAQLQRDGAAGIAALQAQLETLDSATQALAIEALTALAEAAEKK